MYMPPSSFWGHKFTSTNEEKWKIIGCGYCHKNNNCLKPKPCHTIA